MSDEKDPEYSDDLPVDEVTSPTSEEDDPGKGLGVGGNIASLMYDVESDVSGEGVRSHDDDDDDAGAGLGTGGEVKAPQG